jgi:hypothetical protein
MFIRLFLALLVLLGVMWFMSWYGKAAPADRNKAIKTGLLYVVAGALLLLVVTGRIPVIFAAISAAIPIIHRVLAYRGLIGTVGRFAGQKFGATTFTTRWLIVEYDLGKRTLDGSITQGQFTGKKLSQLSELQLNSLLEEVKDDFQSRAAVNAFIIARNGGRYDQNAQPPPHTNGKMTASQAYEILGLGADATDREVKQAHKRLMQKLHPDRGGSSYLASQINAARDTLLNNHV